MPKFAVYVPVVGTAYLGTFEADTAELAGEMAETAAPGVTLCHQCADEIADPEYDWDRIEIEARHD